MEGMTPTDLDGVLDYHSKAWLILEIKYSGEPIPAGQQRCFDRMTRVFSKDTPTLFIIADHDVSDSEQDVDVEATMVRQWSYNGVCWISCSEPLTTGEMVDRFLTLVDEQF